MVRDHIVRCPKPEQNSFGFVTARCDHHEASYSLFQDAAAACVPVQPYLFQARYNLFLDYVFDAHLAQHNKRGLQICLFFAWLQDVTCLAPQISGWA